MPEDDDDKTKKPTQYSYSWDNGQSGTEKLATGNYNVTVQKPTAAESMFAEDGDTPTESEPVSIEQQSAKTNEYLSSVVKSNGSMGGEDAFKFLEYLRAEVVVTQKNSEGVEEQTPTYPNMAAFFNAANDIAPDKAAEILTNVRGSIYNHAKSAPNDAAVQQQCHAYLTLLANPVIPTEEQLKQGINPGFNIVSSKPEYDDQVLDLKTGLTTLFDPKNQNIANMLKECTTLDNPNTFQHFSDIVNYFHDPKLTITPDPSNLPQKPYYFNEDGSLSVCINHASFKDRKFDHVLPGVLATLLNPTLDPDGITPDFIQPLMKNHDGIGTTPVNPDGTKTKEDPAAEDGGVFYALLGAIMGADKVTDAFENITNVFADNVGDPIMDLFGNMFTSPESKGAGIGLVSQLFEMKSSFMSMLPTIMEKIMGFFESIIPSITNTFNAFAGNTPEQTPKQQMKNNATDVTEPKNQVAHVDVTLTPEQKTAPTTPS